MSSYDNFIYFIKDSKLSSWKIVVKLKKIVSRLQKPLIINGHYLRQLYPLMYFHTYFQGKCLFLTSRGIQKKLYFESWMHLFLLYKHTLSHQVTIGRRQLPSEEYAVMQKVQLYPRLENAAGDRYTSICCKYSQMNSFVDIIRGGTVLQWLALSPDSKKVLGLIP